MFENLVSRVKGEFKKPLFSKKIKESSSESSLISENKEKKEKKEEVRFKINFNPEKPELGVVEDKTKVDLRYGVIIPYAYIHLYWDEVQGEVVYHVEEPNLDVKEKEVLNLLEQGIQELIDISFINVDEKEVLIEYLEKNVKVLMKELGINLVRASYLKVMYYIYRDFIGLNKIEALMNDPYIEDIECNGKKSPVYIVHRKFGNIKTNIVYEDMEELVSFVEKLAQKCGKYVSYANPIMDGRLSDSGARVNATYTEDISSKGPTFSIRLFTKEAWSPIKLMQVGTVSAEMLAYLWIAIENGINILIVGGTGSGKTSLTNVIASFIRPEARIVSIEDTREIRLMHENWLPSVARAGMGVGEKTGEVTLFDLLKASFRQRPDYVIVGEIRGKEAFVLFQGMASGHSGISTMHADDVKTVIRRLETEPINLSPSLVETLDIICLMSFAKVKGEDARKLKAIQEVIKVGEGGEAEVNVPFMWDPRRNVFMFKRESEVFKKIVTKKGVSLGELNREFNIRVKLLGLMYKKKIVEFEDVQKIINAYYKNKTSVLKRFGL